MDFVGIVKSIDNKICCFHLQENVTVYIFHTLKGTSKQKYPRVGEKVILKNACYHIHNGKVQKLFLCEHSTMICDHYTIELGRNNLINVVEKYKLGVSDLLEIDYNLEHLKNIFNDCEKVTPEEIMGSILKTLAETSISSGCTQIDELHVCNNKIVPKTSLKTVSNLRYVDLTGEKDPNIPYWSFGVHNSKPTEKLVGFLKINEKFGLFLLKDTKYMMVSVITGVKDESVHKLLHKYVMIKKYRIFTEIFKEPGVSNLEYLIFDISDVEILDIPVANIQNRIYFDTVIDAKEKLSFRCKILNKATIMVNMKNERELWLEVLMLTQGQQSVLYLGLGASYLQIAPILQIGHWYSVYCEQELLQKSSNIELQKLKPGQQFLKITETGAVFIKENNYGDAELKVVNSVDNILTVDEVLEQLNTSTGLISFQGVIKLKKFTNALSSRTNKGIKQVGFGTLGSRSHSLEFYNEQRDKAILLYINNWENMLMPFALVSDMRVSVRNVVVQKQKYLKSTGLTSFEILSYEPKINFDTVKLHSEVSEDWGRRSFLGAGNLIPNGVCIWSTITKLKIKSLNLSYPCINCDKINQVPGSCTCGGKERKFKCTMTFYAIDEFGESMVISKCAELFRILFDLEPQEWTVWLEGFESIGSYVYDRYEKRSEHDEPHRKLLCESLTMAVDAINLFPMAPRDLQIQCRKIENSWDDKRYLPQWFCVKARKMGW